MFRSGAIALCVLVSSAALVSCGGGSGSPAPLTMSEYIQRADAVCEEGHRELESEKAGIESPSATPAEKAGLMVEAMKHEVDGLRELTPPGDQRSAVESMIQMEENQAGNVEALAAAAESGQQERLQAVLGEGHAEQQRLAAAAQQLGFHVCGQSR